MTEKPKTRRKPAKRRNLGGRPPWMPSSDDRTSVERMKYCGESDNTIAMALGVDVETMRKHMKYELMYGAARQRQKIVDVLFKHAVKEENLTAAKRLEEIGRVAGAAEEMGQQQPPAVKVKFAKLGKKAELQAAAEQVDGIFAAPPPPKLVVNNK